MKVDNRYISDSERIRLMIAIETEDEHDLVTQPVLFISLQSAGEADREISPRVQAPHSHPSANLALA
jgi:hypothetical protein